MGVFKSFIQKVASAPAKAVEAAKTVYAKADQKAGGYLPGGSTPAQVASSKTVTKTYNSGPAVTGGGGGRSTPSPGMDTTVTKPDGTVINFYKQTGESSLVVTGSQTANLQAGKKYEFDTTSGGISAGFRQADQVYATDLDSGQRFLYSQQFGGTYAPGTSVNDYLDLIEKPSTSSSNTKPPEWTYTQNQPSSTFNLAGPRNEPKTMATTAGITQSTNVDNFLYGDFFSPRQLTNTQKQLVKGDLFYDIDRDIDITSKKLAPKKTFKIETPLERATRLADEKRGTVSQGTNFIISPQSPFTFNLQGSPEGRIFGVARNNNGNVLSFEEINAEKLVSDTSIFIEGLTLPQKTSMSQSTVTSYVKPQKDFFETIESGILSGVDKAYTSLGQGKKGGVPIGVVLFGAGIATDFVATGKGLYTIGKDPIKTLFALPQLPGYLGGLATGKIDFVSSQVDSPLAQSPAFRAGFFAGEFLQIITPTERALSLIKNIAIRLDPFVKFKKVETSYIGEMSIKGLKTSDDKILDLGLIPRRKAKGKVKPKVFMDIQALSGIDRNLLKEPTLTGPYGFTPLEKAWYLGKTGPVTSSSRDFFTALLFQKDVKLKEIAPDIGLFASLWSKETGMPLTRISRLGGKSEPGTILDLLTGKASLFAEKRQVLLFPKETIGKKGGFQVFPEYTVGEFETFIKNDVLIYKKNTLARTSIEGQIVTIYEVGVKEGGLSKETSNLLKRNKINKLSDMEIKKLESNLSKETGFEVSRSIKGKKVYPVSNLMQDISKLSISTKVTPKKSNILPDISNYSKINKDLEINMTRFSPDRIFKKDKEVSPIKEIDRIFKTSKTTDPNIYKELDRLTPRFDSPTTTRKNVTQKVPPTKSIPKKILVDFAMKKEKYPRTVKKKGYYVQAKSKGNWKTLNPKKPVSKQDALNIGSYVVDNTISARFRVKPSGQSVTKLASANTPGTFEGRSNKFRPYRIIKGRKIGMYNDFIEKKGKSRIDTFGEKNDLDVARFINNKRLVM